MGDGNVVTMNFKVSPRLKKLIEEHARSKKMQVSEYIREAILFDMIMSGNTDALKFVALGVGEKVSGAVRNMIEKLRKEKGAEN